jgi:hypothetical protein
MAGTPAPKDPFMSKSTSSRSPRSPRSPRSSSDTAARGRATKKKAAPATIAAGAPWVEDGIDYGPARAAVEDLVGWVLDLAEREVDGDPADIKRIRKVRRSFHNGLDGRVPVDDLIFVGQILARVFDRDLGLGLADQLAIFEKLELDTDVLPLWAPMPRRQSSTSVSGLTPTRVPTQPAARTSMPTVRIRFEGPASPRVPAPSAIPCCRAGTAPTPNRKAPPPLRFCDDCGYVHEPGDHVFQRRNAA